MSRLAPDGNRPYLVQERCKGNDDLLPLRMRRPCLPKVLVGSRLATIDRALLHIVE